VTQGRAGGKVERDMVYYSALRASSTNLGGSRLGARGAFGASFFNRALGSKVDQGARWSETQGRAGGKVEREAR
jgi:hypothetical protein